MSASSRTYLDYQLQQHNYDSSEWAELYYQQQIEADYYREAQQAGNAVPVVQMYTDTLPAQPAALNPFVDELVKANHAITLTLSELNMMLLNAATPELRSQVKKIVTGLINKAPLMDSTKENYLQMLDAAEANAACYYSPTGIPDTTLTPTPSNPLPNPYKRKYDSAADIETHLATASTRKEIASLYYINAELIEQTPTLKQAFIERKAKFYNNKKVAA